MDRSEINPAPEVDEYSSADEDDGAVPSPIHDKQNLEVRHWYYTIAFFAETVPTTMHRRDIILHAV